MRHLAFLATLLIGIGGCQAEPLELDMTTAAQQANDFAGRFYDQVAASEAGNLFFSPLSIHAALSMTYAGARNATAEQMRDVLRFKYGPEEGAEHHAYSGLLMTLNDPPTISVEAIKDRKSQVVERPAFDLLIANRLWGQEGFEWNPGYLALTEREYLAGLETVDFESNAESARGTINGWVEEVTHDRIRDLVPAGALNALTRLVLTNAIYFKANWVEAFSENSTRPEPFYLQDGDSREVSMMNQTSDFAYAETENYQALSLPYEGSALSMIVVLPVDHEGALSDLERQLSDGKLLGELDALEETEVRVSLPKFTMTQTLNLKPTLESMGMPLAFSDEADFSGMASDVRLQITEALHKAFVEVDEKGTEAAAATAIVIGLTSMPMEPEEPKVFRADRPFVFLIRHNDSGAILFMGRVTDPGG